MLFTIGAVLGSHPFVMTTSNQYEYSYFGSLRDLSPVHGSQLVYLGWSRPIGSATTCAVNEE